MMQIKIKYEYGKIEDSRNKIEDNSPAECARSKKTKFPL